MKNIIAVMLTILVACDAVGVREQRNDPPDNDNDGQRSTFWKQGRYAVYTAGRVVCEDTGDSVDVPSGGLLILQNADGSVEFTDLDSEEDALGGCPSFDLSFEAESSASGDTDPIRVITLPPRR